MNSDWWQSLNIQKYLECMSEQVNENATICITEIRLEVRPIL